jgi:hypothetical protein
MPKLQWGESSKREVGPPASARQERKVSMEDLFELADWKS